MGNLESVDGGDYCGPPTNEEEFRKELERESSGSLNQRYASVHFREHDQVYIMWGDDEFRQICVRVMNQQLGVSSTREYSKELLYVKMTGWPFSVNQIGGGKESAVELRRGAAEVLRMLFTVGWVLVGSSSLTRCNSVSSWFFQRFPAGEAMFAQASDLCYREGTALVVNISSDDKIQVLNAGQALLHRLTQVISDNYGRGIQNVDDDLPNCRTFKLCGNPWQFSGETKTDGVILVAKLLAAIEEASYSFYGTADFKGTCDSIFFMPTTSEAHFHESDYMILTMDDNDDLRVQNAEEGMIAAISHVVSSSWPQGVQRDGHFRGGYEWKLSGNPWWSSGTESIHARQMLIAIFDLVSEMGFEHYTTLDLSRKLNDKSTIIFRRNPFAKRMKHAVISPSSTDKLRLIGFPSSSMVHRSIPNAVSSTWKRGLANVNQHDDGTTEMKINGTPFSNVYCWKSENYARIMMCAILAALNDEGWHLVSSCDVSAKHVNSKNAHHPLDLDCWIVGTPVSDSVRTNSQPTPFADHFAPSAPTGDHDGPPSPPPSYTSEMPPTYEEALEAKAWI